MAKIIIPTPLRKFTDNQASFEANAGTVKDAIGELIKEYDGLSQHILDKEGNLRSFVKVYVGDEDINGLEKEATAVATDTVISIVPAIAGGAA